MILLNIVGQPLITPAAPYGIVSFELAGNVTEASEMLSSWDSDARLHASFSLGFDYVWMLFYSTTIALVLILFGSLAAPWPQVARWCAIFKFALIFAGMVYAFLG